MISKAKLKNTAVIYWSADDEVFAAESSLMPGVIVGVGENRQEARDKFERALDDVYDEVSSDNVAGYKVGRPTKGYVAFNANIRPSSKAMIAKLSDDMEISQGEVLDYLVFYLECKEQETGKALTENEIKSGITEILQEMRSLKEAIDEKPKTVVNIYARTSDLEKYALVSNAGAANRVYDMPGSQPQLGFTNILNTPSFTAHPQLMKTQ